MSECFEGTRSRESIRNPKTMVPEVINVFLFCFLRLKEEAIDVKEFHSWSQFLGLHIWFLHSHPIRNTVLYLSLDLLHGTYNFIRMGGNLSVLGMQISLQEL